MYRHPVYHQLRTYQQTAVNFLSNTPRSLEYDDMGLGKTVTLATTLESNRIGSDLHNFLITSPTKGLSVWKEELRKWFGKECIIYSGTPAKRKKLWQEFLSAHHVEYLVTTYGMLQEIADNVERDKAADRFAQTAWNKQSPWQALVADEIDQAGLLNHKSKTYATFEKVARDIPRVHLMTGTPIRQGVIDTYAPLHVVDSKMFPAYWPFINKHCITIDGPYGKEIERRPKHPEQFREIMNRYMIRRTKDELRQSGDLEDLPGKQRQPIKIEMTSKQREVHDALIQDMFVIDGDVVIMAPSQMAVMLRARQLLTCPRILGIDDDGGALNYIIEEGASLLDNGSPFAIFTPFKQAIPYIQAAIMNKMPSTHIYVLSGGMKPEDFGTQWQTFQRDPSKRKVLLCVIKSGASFQATEASYGFFLGYEWDFNQNTQAEDRLCRLGQKDFVNIYYMTYEDTVDEDVMNKLNDKKDASDWIIGDEEQYSMLLKRFKMLRKVSK